MDANQLQWFLHYIGIAIAMAEDEVRHSRIVDAMDSPDDQPPIDYPDDSWTGMFDNAIGELRAIKYRFEQQNEKTPYSQ